MTKKYVGWVLLISLATLMFAGLIEGFTGQPLLGTAGDTVVGMITFMAGVFGAVLLIKE